MMKPRWAKLTVLALAPVLGVGALAGVGLANAPDPTMEAFCSVPAVLDEDAFFQNRVGFNWTSGTELQPIALSVPGYAPAEGARFEEMRVDSASLGAIANAALGRGRVWAMLREGGAIGSVVDAPDYTPLHLLPENTNSDDVLAFELVEGAGSCDLQDWLAEQVERSDDDIYMDDDRNFIPIQIREELESSVPDALRVMRTNRATRRCLQARWTPREQLPLHAYRIYEVRRSGLFNYWLSPHIVTDSGRVVYFSMSVVRTSALHDALGANVAPPLKRACCVSPLRVPHCSRFGGPDPYRFDIETRRAFVNRGRSP